MAGAEDNLTRQIEEVEALSAIYGDDWSVVDEATRVYSVNITDGQVKPLWTLGLQVSFPIDYPGEAPPVYELHAPWLKKDERRKLSNMLEEIFSENLGNNIIYLWVEKIREFLLAKTNCSDIQENVNNNIYDENEVQHSIDKLVIFNDIEIPPIIHGPTFTDRRSTFQAHLIAPIIMIEQVKLGIESLKENKKIANATHNIMAYRIFRDKNSILQDCDDDGEDNAGSRLLHLLQILDVHNVLIVVSRWFGGIRLGPDRFKHINNCARNILKDAGYIQDKLHSEEASETKKMKSKKNR